VRLQQLVAGLQGRRECPLVFPCACAEVAAREVQRTRRWRCAAAPVKCSRYAIGSAASRRQNRPPRRWATGDPRRCRPGRCSGGRRRRPAPRPPVDGDHQRRSPGRRQGPRSEPRLPRLVRQVGSESTTTRDRRARSGVRPQFRRLQPRRRKPVSDPRFRRPRLSPSTNRLGRGGHPSDPVVRTAISRPAQACQRHEAEHAREQDQRPLRQRRMFAAGTGGGGTTTGDRSRRTLS